MDLIVDKITKVYGDKRVLNDISFTVKAGTCLGLMGESGSGKSTIGRLLIGLENPTAGTISFNGIYYHNMSKKQLTERCSNIQIVFQNAFGAVNPKFTVKQILFEPLKLLAKNKMTVQEKIALANDMLKHVGLENISLDQLGRNLSGGQLQRLCIARALIIKPKVIILDESLSGLDPLIQRQILDLLGDLKNEFNLTYIFIAHDFMSCYYLCDEIIILDKGEIIDTINPSDAIVNITNERTTRLIGDFCSKGNCLTNF